MASTILWQNVAALNAALDIKVASFTIALVLAVGVSLATSRPSREAR
jgi:hypothetical protein